jgi:hypothetical protein
VDRRGLDEILGGCQGDDRQGICSRTATNADDPANEPTNAGGLIMDGIAVFMIFMAAVIIIEIAAAWMSEQKRRAEQERVWREKILASFSEYENE